MRFLRVLISGFLLLLLLFFLAGVASSNEWETDSSSSVSAGMLGKIVLIPICIVLGLLLFKVAGPLFGGTRYAAQSEKYQAQARAKVSSDNRYRMGDALPLVYGAAILGLILILTGIVTANAQRTVIGIALAVGGLIIRGRLESQRVAAKTIGARTLADDVAESLNLAGTVTVGLAKFAVESAITGGKVLARKVSEALNSEDVAASPNVEEMLSKSSGAIPENFNVAEFLADFIRLLRTNFDTHLTILRSPGTSTQVFNFDNPVLTGRRNLLDAYISLSPNTAPARELLASAILRFDSGAVKPDPREWPIDGPEVGRGHACMWGGIARTFSHMHSSHTFGVDATNADSWFGTGALIFFETGELTMAGRTIQEWAESRRLTYDFKGADFLFLVAGCIFACIGEIDRAHTATARVNAREPVKVDSSFFLDRPPTEQEVSLLSTVLGARNSYKFYDVMR